MRPERSALDREDGVVDTLRRVFTRMAWRDQPVVHLRYWPGDDALVARFLPLDGARRQYLHDRLCVEFDGGDHEALPTALAVTGFLDGARSPTGRMVRDLLGDLVWRRAVELSVSGDQEREVDLDVVERDARLTAWRDFVSRPRLALGVESGPHGIRAVLVDERGEVLDRWRRSLDVPGPEAVAVAVGRLADEVRAARGDDLVVGLQIVGPVNREADGAPAGLVEAHYGVHTLLLTGVEALATYERWFELRDTVSRYAVLLVDEGIGGALVVDGRIDTGMPMDLGDVVVHPGGRRCRCGDRGCVEATAAMWAIVERVRQDAEADVEDLAGAVDLADRGGVRGVTAEAVFRSAGRDLAAGIDAVQALADVRAWVIYVPGALAAGTVARDGFLSGLTSPNARDASGRCAVQLRTAPAEHRPRGAALAALEEFGISSPRGAGRAAPVT